MLRIGMVVLLALVPVLAHAQIVYKWVDENGRTQYSDHPPPQGVKFEQIGGGTATAPAPPAANAPASNLSTQELEFRKRQIEAAEKAKKEEEDEKAAKAKQQNCDLARSRLKTMEDGGRILKPNAAGEREYMGDEEIETEKIKAQKSVAEICK
jgi:uncharacterized protein DUF4124